MASLWCLIIISLLLLSAVVSSSIVQYNSSVDCFSGLPSPLPFFRCSLLYFLLLDSHIICSTMWSGTGRDMEWRCGSICEWHGMITGNKKEKKQSRGRSWRKNSEGRECGGDSSSLKELTNWLSTGWDLCSPRCNFLLPTQQSSKTFLFRYIFFLPSSQQYTNYFFRMQSWIYMICLAS